MTHTLYQALRSLEPELSASLVEPGARAGLLALAARLPGVGGTQYLECRLGAAAARRVDLLIAITRLQPPPELPASSSGQLEPLRRLLDYWSPANPSLREMVPVVWLEFDNVRQQSELRASVCACIVPSYIAPSAPIVSLPSDQQWQLLEELVGVIRGSPCAAVEQTLLRRCVQLLPAGAHWIHLSVMTERNPVDIKLYGAFPRDTLLDYLDRLGWPGQLTQIERLIERYCPPQRTGALLYVDLPFTAALLRHEPSLGVSFSRQHLNDAEEKDPQRLPLLARLVEDELCSREQADALADWPRIAASLRGDPLDFQRWFDVKLVQLPGEPLLAKAYLGFSSIPKAQSW